MSALIQKTLAEIAQKQIQPVPAWQSRAKNILYWVGTLVLLVFGALAIELSLHAIFEIDWEAYSKADFSWLQIILSGVPIFSLVLLGLFLWATTLLIRQTRRGHRYPVSLLLGIFLLFNVVLGFGIEESPLDEPSERFLLGLIPHTEKNKTVLVPSASRQWSQPERGLLGGTVLSSNEASLLLRDSTQQLWMIDYTNATVQAGVLLEPDQEVKVIGEQNGDRTFRATEVRAWKKTPVKEREQEQEKEEDDTDEEDSKRDAEREEYDE